MNTFYLHRMKPLMRLTSGVVSLNSRLNLIHPGAAASTAWRSFSNFGDDYDEKKSEEEERKQKLNNKRNFRPRRKQSRSYRPVQTESVRKKKLRLSKDHKLLRVDNMPTPKKGAHHPAPNYDPSLDAMYGTPGADLIRDLRHRVAHPHEYETDEYLKIMDYWTADQGSTEEKVFERRALAHHTPEEREKFFSEIEDTIEEGEKVAMPFLESEFAWGENFSKVLAPDPNKVYLRKLKRVLKRGGTLADVDDPSWNYATDSDDDEDSDDEREQRRMEQTMDDQDPTAQSQRIQPNQKAFGNWSEMLISTRMGNKLWKGGRLESYRAYMIAGNMNGCGGFGLGQAKEPQKALIYASRLCKRNIFFVDRYKDGICHDLSGRHNSTRVYIRMNTQGQGLRGNPLMREILMRFGITNAVCKAHDNRHPWNVVMATFKALQTHCSMEDTAMARGRRLVSMDRAMRMKI